MKKILLTILFILAIFQMAVLATAIDVGDTASNRASNSSTDTTYINKGNPANETGTLTSVEMWAITNLTNCEVATFYFVSGDLGGIANFTTRDNETIGSVTSGSKQTFVVDLSVSSGDYIGFYVSSGTLERDTSGFTAIWAHSGDVIPTTNDAFNNYYAGDALSLYATGSTPTEETTNIFLGINF